LEEAMTATGISGIEGTGSSYTEAGFLEMRSRTRSAVHVIAHQITPGLSEEQAKELAKETLKDLDMRRGWHHIIVRCGPNTTKDFMERSEPDTILRDNDIFFIDIGPVYADFEGDAGDTFVLGNDPVHLKAQHDVHEIWGIVRTKWFTEQLTGVELYEFATETAQSFGWNLNLDLSGHRLSDYPHSAHYDGSLAEVELAPSAGLWVLEIAIAHPDGTFGAFYEDLLLEDQSFPPGTFLGLE
jgi:methionyl aminopeptidase